MLKQLRKQAPPNVTFLGWRRDVPELLASSDLLLAPSDAEGLPGVVMEAMMIGTPVAPAAVPCVTDLITSAREGLLCPAGDIECFTASVRKLLHDPDIATAYSEAARRKVLKYSWERTLPSYTDLYHR